MGLPTVMAFGVLADVATGQPELLSELTLTTALRTAATSALAARWLARPGSRTMALIGNGAQAEFQALAFHHLLGIDEIRLFDIDAAATAKLQRNLRNVPGLQLLACTSAADAVRGADIVTTVTADKTRAAILTRRHGRARHAHQRGGRRLPGQDRAASRRAAHGARRSSSTSRKRASRATSSKCPRTLRSPSCGACCKASAPGREDARQITVFDSVGFALEDFSALRWLRDSALELGLGSPAHLVPGLDDPKDLFALLKPAMRRAAPSAGRHPVKVGLRRRPLAVGLQRAAAQCTLGCVVPAALVTH